MGKALHLLTERGPRSLPSLEKAVSHATVRLVGGHEEAPIAVDRLNKILLVGCTFCCGECISQLIMLLVINKHITL